MILHVTVVHVTVVHATVVHATVVHATVVHAKVVYAKVVYVCACDTESTYDCNIVLTSIRGILYNMASKCWMASLNFALITEMGCCLLGLGYKH